MSLYTVILVICIDPISTVVYTNNHNYALLLKVNIGGKVQVSIYNLAGERSIKKLDAGKSASKHLN